MFSFGALGDSTASATHDSLTRLITLHSDLHLRASLWDRARRFGQRLQNQHCRSASVSTGVSFFVGSLDVRCTAFQSLHWCVEALPCGWPAVSKNLGASLVTNLAETHQGRDPRLTLRLSTERSAEVTKSSTYRRQMVKKMGAM